MESCDKLCEKVEVESDRCRDDYAGEEARRKKVMEEVAKVEVEEGGSTKVTFSRCQSLHLHQGALH